MICVTSAVSPALCGDFTTQDRHLAVLPMQHIFALCKVRRTASCLRRTASRLCLLQFIHHAVWWGITTVVLPKFDLDDWCSAVQKYKITVGIVVPPLLVLIAKSPVVSKYDLSSIKMFMSGAAPLSAELGDQVEKRLPTCRVTQVRPDTPARLPPPRHPSPIPKMLNFSLCARALVSRRAAR